VARSVARERNERLFLAGGVVRDLLLGRPVRDVDLVVEGDAPAFARRLAARLAATARVHARFSTATLALPDGETLDVAATRRETYARPGALPDVAAGAPIEDDLARRDFTINALALEVGSKTRLLDPLGGRDDLARGLVRALHEASFRDDPTRALRAVRYANRLGFRLEPATRRWIADSTKAGALDRISADRLRRELRLILEEPRRSTAVRCLQKMGIAAAIHPALGRPAAPARLRRTEALVARTGSAASWRCYLFAWMADASAVEAAGVAQRLGMSGAQQRRLLAWPGDVARLPAGLAGRARSEVRRAARDLRLDEILAIASGLGAADARALLAAAPGSRGPRLSIRGGDLLAAGVPAGPALGRALQLTLAALEDGRVDPSPSAELAFALRAARQENA